MGSLNSVDYGVIIFYLGFLIAIGFYLKQGYKQYGRLEKYCSKYERYYLKKAL